MVTRPRARRAIKTSPEIVRQARARISKPTIQRPRRLQTRTVRSGFTTSSRSIVRRTGQTRKPGKQVTSAIRLRTRASSIPPRVKVIAPPPRASSIPKPPPQRIVQQERTQPKIFNPIANVIGVIQETSARNAARKQELKAAGKLPAQQQKFRDVNIDDIFGGFFS